MTNQLTDLEAMRRDALLVIERAAALYEAGESIACEMQTLASPHLMSKWDEATAEWRDVLKAISIASDDMPPSGEEVVL